MYSVLVTRLVPIRFSPTRSALPCRLGAGAWLALALLTAALAAKLVGDWQVTHRSALVWDEAARVNAGVGFASALDAGSVGAAWNWINAQTFYPFLSSIPHGVALWAGASDVTAAWLPALLGYALCGLLVGKLVRAVGGGRTAAAAGALLFWSTPLEGRLAAGAFTEPMGACFEVAFLLALVRLRTCPTGRAAFVVGTAAALTWWLKYDYGVLVVATLIATLLTTGLAQRRADAVLKMAFALGTALLLIALPLLFNTTAKLEGASDFATPGRRGDTTLHQLRSAFSFDFDNFLYYPQLLFGDGETGVTRVVAIVISGSFLWALLSWRRRPALQPLTCFVVLWLAMYSLAEIHFARFMGTLVPVAVALAAVGAVEGARAVSSAGKGGTLVAAAAAIGLAAGIATQVPRLSSPFYFLIPDQSVSRARAFLGDRLSPTTRPLLMIGASNELSISLVQLAWSHDGGRATGLVEQVPEAAAGARRAVWEDRLRALEPGQIVGVDIFPGSRLDTTDHRVTFASQAAYLKMARALERRHALRRVATFAASGELQVTVWKPNARRRASLRARTCQTARSSCRRRRAADRYAASSSAGGSSASFLAN
jgi:hypothetical protein